MVKIEVAGSMIRLDDSPSPIVNIGSAVETTVKVELERSASRSVGTTFPISG